MKVDGKGQPAPAGASIAEAEGNSPGKLAPPGAEGNREASETAQAFAEKLAQSREAVAAGAPSRTAPPSSLDAAAGVRVGEVAADLRAGRLTAADAVNQMLELVVEQQVGRQAPASLRDQVRAALQDAIENDPLLARKFLELE
ncbi:MAG: hypothetical protein ABUS79_11440 [Pseudomonadota bacterium]